MARELPSGWKAKCGFGQGRKAKGKALDYLANLRRWDPSARLVRITRPAPLGRVVTGGRAGWTALYYVVQRYY